MSFAHYTHEMPPDFDETQYCTDLRAQVEAAIGRTADDWEVTNIRHHKADGVTTYHARVLSGEGIWVIVRWTRDADGNQTLLEALDH